MPPLRLRRFSFPAPSKLDRVYDAGAVGSRKAEIFSAELVARRDRIPGPAALDSRKVLHLVARYALVKVRRVFEHLYYFVRALADCQHVGGKHHPRRVGKVLSLA